MGKEKPAVWFVDTSSLISLAADDGLRKAVQDEIQTQHRVLLDVVCDELERLADEGRPNIKSLAGAALGQLDWLGTPVDTSDKVDSLRVLEIQDVLRSGRALQHPFEHWAESVIMCMADRLQQTTPYLLSEDYNARVESRHHGCNPFSVHKLLSRMVRARTLLPERAAAFADALMASDRGKDYTAEEFTSGWLGRVGHP
ncbi:hypothetical protein OG780_44205 [Streptomyces sp. NBC_00386]|uniref:hypothetical protein n=1 Tax=Streptomyces sp. NBC_00386 TaxID=2975734 RepID=UPI002E1FA367